MTPPMVGNSQPPVSQGRSKAAAVNTSATGGHSRSTSSFAMSPGRTRPRRLSSGRSCRFWRRRWRRSGRLSSDPPSRPVLREDVLDFDACGGRSIPRLEAQRRRRRRPNQAYPGDAVDRENHAIEQRQTPSGNHGPSLPFPIAQPARRDPYRRLTPPVKPRSDVQIEGEFPGRRRRRRTRERPRRHSRLAPHGIRIVSIYRRGRSTWRTIPAS